MYSVSVIMPVHNNENTLGRAIESVLNQTLYDLELILVNDGSTDTSAQICDDYARREPLLVEVIHQEQSGFGPARNKGLLKASGKYVYFADAKDTFNNQMLEANFKLAEEKEADLVVFGFTEQNKKYLDRKLEHLPGIPHLSTQVSFRDHYRNFHRFFPYALHNKIYQRDYLKQHRIRFHKIPLKGEAFFNLSIYKDLNRVAFNRVSYCNRYNIDSSAPSLYQEKLYEVNLELAKFFEAVLQYWKHEEVFRDLIVSEYYNAVYSELLNICTKDSVLSIEQQEVRMDAILKDGQISNYLKDLKVSDEKNPYLKAILVALKNNNGKAAIQLAARKTETNKATSKAIKFFRNIFKS